MGGRFFWSSTSDHIGRKPTYMIFFGLGVVLYFLLAATGTASVAVFVLLTAVILTHVRRRVRDHARRTCGTCSARSTSAPSTAGC